MLIFLQIQQSIPPENTVKIEYKELFTVEALETLRKVAFKVWPQTFAAILSSEQISYMMDMMYSPEVLIEFPQNH